MEEEFLDLINLSNKIKNSKTKNTLNIKFFSNVIAQPIDKIIKYFLDLKNIKTYIEFADFSTLLPSKKKRKI